MTEQQQPLSLLELMKSDEFRLIRIEAGRRIREAREQLGMSQGRLAELLSRRQAYISEMETGKTEPNATMLAQLALVLRKPVEYFFPPNYRDFSETRDAKLDTLTIEEKQLIARVRSLGGFFDQQLAIHFLNALVDYQHRMLSAFDGDIPSDDEIAYQESMEAWTAMQEQAEYEGHPPRLNLSIASDEDDSTE